MPWTFNSPPWVSVRSIEAVFVALRELPMFEVREVLRLRLWLETKRVI